MARTTAQVSHDVVLSTGIACGHPAAGPAWASPGGNGSGRVRSAMTSPTADRQSGAGCEAAGVEETACCEPSADDSRPTHRTISKRPSKCSTTAVQLSTQSPQLM